MISSKEPVNQSFLSHFPDKGQDVVVQWVKEFPVSIRLVDVRKTKAGDYRPGFKQQRAVITLNNDPNKYRLMYVFAHEMAHHVAFTYYGRYIKPHGYQWKNVFFDLLMQLVQQQVFPSAIAAALPEHPARIRATIQGDTSLAESLSKFDGNKQQLYLYEIPDFAFFELENGAQFQKIKKRRIRYLCQNLKNKKYYTIAPGIAVKTIKNKGNRNS
ncbi:MAG: SprT-like domain-containing protein [Bacteroidales bacterium]